MVTRRRYWVWPDAPPERKEVRGDEVDEFRALVEDAVRCRLRSTSPTAIYLSGGLDSGAVASVAGKQRQDDPSVDVRAYSCVFDRFPTVDERRYSEAVTDGYALPHTLIDSDDCWTLSTLDPWLPVFNEPLLGPHEALNFRALPIVRDDGARTLLTGRGGDVMFMGTARYFATWLLHGRWGSLREQLRRKRPTSRHSYAYQFAAWALFPLAPGQCSGRCSGASTRWAAAAVDASGSGDSLPREPAPLRLGGAARGWWQDRRDDVDELARTPVTPYFDRLMRMHGLESRHPLLDRRLVEFALKAPPDVFFRDGISRWIFVEALRDVIPPLVRDRQDKASAAPLLAYGLRERRAAFVRSLLVDSELKGDAATCSEGRGSTTWALPRGRGRHSDLAEPVRRALVAPTAKGACPHSSDVRSEAEGPAGFAGAGPWPQRCGLPLLPFTDDEADLRPVRERPPARGDCEMTRPARTDFETARRTRPVTQFARRSADEAAAAVLRLTFGTTQSGFPDGRRRLGCRRGGSPRRSRL